MVVGHEGFYIARSVEANYNPCTAGRPSTVIAEELSLHDAGGTALGKGYSAPGVSAGPLPAVGNR